MNDFKPSLSIITPAYNRGNMLYRCFDSLCSQTCRDFEWIVVNDGSRDNTEAVMREILVRPAPFVIHYVLKENGGKHTALNAAHPYIHGKYVLILDSDDTLTADAVEQVLDGWGQYQDDSEVCLVTFLRQNQNGQVLARAEKEYIPMDYLNDNRICLISSDCCEVIRADVFLRYPFPVFEGEYFLAETVLWYRAGLDGSCIYINKPIYICEYLEGGLTKVGRKLRISNPNGGMYTSDLRMNKRCRMAERLKAGVLYCCYGFFAGCSLEVIIKKTDRKLLAALCLLPGYVLYLYWKRKYL